MNKSAFLEQIEEIQKDRKGVVESSVYPGIKELVSEIYPEEAHFIYELLQNAEDACADTVYFEIRNKMLVFRHNGSKLFDSDDVDAITNIAKSTKRENFVQAGKFGIGFKSVYAFTDTPSIYCDTVCFEIQQLLLPVMIQDLDDREKGWTEFHFPYNSPKITASDAKQKIKQGLKEVETSTLLFLNNINKLEYNLGGKTLYTVLKETDGYITTCQLLKNGRYVQKKDSWMRFSRNTLLNGKSIQVDIAFPMQASDKESRLDFAPGTDRVYIKFIAKNEKSNLRFYINAPFGCTPSRDTVNKRDASNGELLRQISLLMKHALSEICDKGLMSDSFLENLPIEEERIPVFYEPLVEAIWKTFKDRKILPTVTEGRNVTVDNGIMSSKSVIDRVFTQADIRSLYQNNQLCFVKNYPVNSRAYKFLKSLNIKELTSEKILIQMTKISETQLMVFLQRKRDRQLSEIYAYLFKGYQSMIQQAEKFQEYKKYGESAYYKKYRKSSYEVKRGVQYIELEQQIQAIKCLKIVKTSDNVFVCGADTYFEENGIEAPKEILLVKKTLYEKDTAKQFLSLLGTKTFTSEELEEYKYNNEITQMEQYLSDLVTTKNRDAVVIAKRILSFLENHKIEEVLWNDHNIVEVFSQKKSSFVWKKISECYLDSPLFEETGFRFAERIHKKYELSNNYSQLNIEEMRKWADFLIDNGALGDIQVNKVEKDTGYRTGIDVDYSIDNLKRYLRAKKLDLSRYIWKKMIAEGGWHSSFETYHYQLNKNYPEEIKPSSVLSDFTKCAWIPDQNGVFKTPENVSRSTIDRTFPIDESNGFLEAIQFGAKIKKIEEEEWIRNERERLKQSQQIDAALKLGFESPEEVLTSKEKSRKVDELLALGIDIDDLLAKKRREKKEKERKSLEGTISERESESQRGRDNYVKDVPAKRNMGRKEKVEEDEPELEDLLVKIRNRDTRGQQEAEQVAATRESDRKEGGESSETVDNPNIDDIFDEYDKAEDNLSVGTENSNETTEENDYKSGKKENRDRGKKTKDVVKDIYNRAKGISSVLSEEKSGNEDYEESDQDEFMPSPVDYRKIIERAMEKSATEVRKIAYFEELQTRAMEAKKYSYAWFNALLEMESINSAEANANSREVSISFSVVERELGTKRTLILKYPNRYIPQFMEDLSDIPLILHIGNQKKTVPIEVASIRSYTLRVKMKREDVVEGIDLASVNAATIEAKSPVFLIEELRKEFSDLRFDDDYDMQMNLPENIEFVFGPPGTGKTTYLARNILMPMMEGKDDCKVLVLAPTNKASDVLVRRIMELSEKDKNYENWLVRFGATVEEDIEQSPVFRDKTFDIRTLHKCVTITTIARFPYDYFMPHNARIFLRGVNWDYIVFDEASMIPIADIVYPIYKKTPRKFIIAGDPFQIEPVTTLDLWKNVNIYTMVKLDSFVNPTTIPHQYKVELLTTQYRSVPDIGDIFSKFAYGGVLKHHREAEDQKSLYLREEIGINTLNIIKYPVSKYESIYRPKRLQHSSSYQVYSALFTFEYVCFLSREIAANNQGKQIRIGIIAPYRAQADIINKLIASEKLPEEVEVEVGTIHGFQGDECDIIFAVFNPPPTISASREMFLNKKNIINVSVSRARDYLFIVMPDDNTEKIENLKLVKRVEYLIKHTASWKELQSPELERQMFRDSRYLESNTFSTSHQSVNVYGLPERCYEIRTEDMAVDVQIHKGAGYNIDSTD